MGGNWERDVYERAHALVTPPSHGAVEVSLITVGEAFTKLADREWTHRSEDGSILERWFRMLDDGRISVCWAKHHDPTADVLSLATQVRARAPGVGPADCLIVSSALACHDCRWFYTTDRRLLTNPALRKFCTGGGRDLRLAEVPILPRIAR